MSYSFFRQRAVIGGQLFSCHHQKIVLTGQDTALLRIYRNHKSTGNQIMAQKILPDKLRCQKNYQNFVVGNSIDGNSDDGCNHCSNPHEKNSLKDYFVSLRHLRRMVKVVGGRTWLKGDLLV